MGIVKKKTIVEKKTQNVFNYEIGVDLNCVIRYIRNLINSNEESKND